MTSVCCCSTAITSWTATAGFRFDPAVHLVDALLVFNKVALDAFARIEQVALLVEEQQDRGRCCRVVNIDDLHKTVEALTVCLGQARQQL
jgi:hypothetical protein